MRILGVGDNVVDRYLDDGVMYPGGNAVNVAVHARRLGAETAYCGVLGTDAAGDLVHRALLEEGVLLDRARREIGPNAYANVQLVNGDRRFMGSDRGVAEFRLDDDDFNYAATFDVVHTAYSGTLSEDVPRLAELTSVSFDFSYRRDAPYRDSILPHLLLATFSGGHLPDAEIAELAQHAHDGGARFVLVTAGERGAHFVGSDGNCVRWPAEQAEVIDTMGAGDAFIAALLINLIRDSSVHDALQQAALSAARACSEHGGWGHPEPFLQKGNTL